MKKKSVRLALACFAGCFALTLTGCGSKSAKSVNQQEENRSENTENMDTEDEEMTENKEQTVEELPNQDLTMEETGETQPELKPEELPTDENGVVVDCPKDVYTKRTGMEYGTVEHITYHSETTGSDRGANVLLPAGYSAEKKYPVLYFQHGIFGDEYSMTNDNNNHVKEIFGNLAADGLAREVIVVFTSMFATSDPNLKPGFTAEQTLPYDNFINDLVNDLMPYMEANYSILTGRDNTAVLGFSMGGRESLYIGVTRPDLFAYTGGISPAPGLTPGRDWAMEHVGQMQEDELKITDTENLPKLLMVCCGSKDSVVGAFPKSYHEIMERNGVDHMWYEIPGADHDNQAIRSGIYNFMIRWPEPE